MRGPREDPPDWRALVRAHFPGDENVDADPTNPASVALREVAERLVGRGRGLAGLQLGLTPTSKF